MNYIKTIRVFLSTVLFFLFGFFLNIIIQNLFGSKTQFFYIFIQLLTMILSGTVIFFLLNWKYLEKNRKVSFVKEKITFHIKCRICFTIFLIFPAIYYSSIGYKHLNNISLVLGKVNDLIFHMEHKTFVLNFYLVSSNLFTVFSIVVLIMTYIILEILFVNTQRINSR